MKNVKKLFTQTQTGGYYLKSQPIYTSKDIEDKILSFNQIIKQTIEAIFNEMPEHNNAVDLGNIPFSTEQSHGHCIFS